MKTIRNTIFAMVVGMIGSTPVMAGAPETLDASNCMAKLTKIFSGAPRGYETIHRRSGSEIELILSVFGKNGSESTYRMTTSGPELDNDLKRAVRKGDMVLKFDFGDLWPHWIYHESEVFGQAEARHAVCGSKLTRMQTSSHRELHPVFSKNPLLSAETNAGREVMFAACRVAVAKVSAKK